MFFSDLYVVPYQIIQEEKNNKFTTTVTALPVFNEIIFIETLI